MRMRRLLRTVALGTLLSSLPLTQIEAGEARLHLLGLLHDAHLVRGQDFSANSLRDLLIIVEYRNLSGPYTQTIDLYSPDGVLYQQFRTPVTLGGSGTSNRVEVRLLVAGTWITQHSLFGAWRVEVFLDRRSTPIASGVFVLRP